jgi:hypothetical protein
MLPFAGELAAAFENRHEPVCKGIAASPGNGADDPVKGNGHNTEGQTAERGKGRNPLLKNRQVRVGVGLDSVLVNAETFPAGFAVMIHIITSFLI